VTPSSPCACPRFALTTRIIGHLQIGRASAFIVPNPVGRPSQLSVSKLRVMRTERHFDGRRLYTRVKPDVEFAGYELPALGGSMPVTELSSDRDLPRTATHDRYGHYFFSLRDATETVLILPGATVTGYVGPEANREKGRKKQTVANKNSARDIVMALRTGSKLK
jgi:hypothetical protein